MPARFRFGNGISVFRFRTTEPARGAGLHWRTSLAPLAGAVAATGHAPFNLWPLALLGLTGLAWIVAAADGGRNKAVAAWFGGVGYFAVSLFWIIEPFYVDSDRHGWMAPFAIVLVATGFALFWALAGWLSARTGGGAIGWALSLSLAEILRGHVLTGFPWALPGYIWTETPAIMGASVVGPYGLTTLTLILAALPVATPRKVIATLVALLAIAALVAWGRAAQMPSEAHVGVIRVVQPNAPQHEKWDPARANVFLRRQLLATSAPGNDVALVIWPESALQYRLDKAGTILKRMANAAGGTPVVFGVDRVDGRRRFNAMVQIDADGSVTDIYDKVHLVPFGEYVPFGGLAERVGIRGFAARDGFGYSAGSDVPLIDTPLGRALPMICYETIFPGHVRRAGERPDYLLQITNDAWFGTISGPFQHLQQARFRAVEQGLPLVRSANTGVSAVIGPDGRILDSLPLGESGFVDVPLPAPRPATIYARTGDLPVVLLLLMGLAAVLRASRAIPLSSLSESRNGV